MIESNNNLASMISTNNNLQGQINSENNLRGQMSSPNNLRGAILGSGSNSGGGGGGGDMYKAVYDTNNNGIVDNAEKVNNHTVESDVPSNAVFTDTTYTAGTGINITNGVISNTQTSAKWGNITGTLTEQTDLKNALDGKADTTDIPDVSSFITKSVNDLAYYYTKNDTYTQAEINSLIGAISTINIVVVQTLPTQDISSSTIYLVPNSTSQTNNIYDEYVYVSNSWEKIGNTQIDLSDYITTTQLNNALADYTLTTDLTSLLNNKQDVLSSGSNIKTINGQSILGAGDLTVVGETMPVGSIIELPTIDSTKVPAGWLFCDGTAISRTTYSDLFNVIGTTYGSGDGSTTFNLPNLINFIIKVNATTPTQAQVVDSLESNSTTDAPSVHAVNAVIDNITTCSTSEKTIGKDTNGKPIYRKTIIYSTALTGGNNDIPHNIANLGKVYNAYGNLNGSGIGGNYMIGAYESATRFVSINSVNYSYVKLRIGSDWANSFTGGCTVTLEYTKTTD